MAAFEVTGIQLRIEPKAEITAGIRDWVTDPGPNWPGRPLHGTWLYIGALTLALPQDPAARLAVLERLGDAVETLAADARALTETPAEAADGPFGDPAIVGVNGHPEYHEPEAVTS
jgi:hypothetical protein